MVDEINFVDLACLMKITPDTTLEKLGSTINASIFDASNLAGGLKQKSLIDFSSYYPGPTTIVISDTGKALIAEAEAKAAEPLDKLDQEVLFQMSGGKRLPVELQNTLNIRSKDLALHIYKLSKQGLLIYELKSGGADLSLTEAGFIKAKGAQPQVTPTAAATVQPQKMDQPMPTMPAAEQPAQTAAPQDVTLQPKPKSNMMLYLLIIVVLIVIAVLYYAVILKKSI